MLSITLAASLWAAFPTSGSAQSGLVLGPEAGPAVLEALVAEAFPGGWVLEGIEVRPEHAELTFRQGETSVSLRLRHTEVQGACFAVEGPPAGAEALRRSVERRLATLGERCPWRGTILGEQRGHGSRPESVQAGSRRGLATRMAEHRGLVLSAVVLVLFFGFSAVRTRWTERLVALLALAMVAAWAWWVDDAFITYHYARRLLDGDGLVFNVGERVQGFTHPLWLFLVAGLGAALTPPLASLLLGGLFTAVLLALLARGVEWLERPPIVFAVALSVLFTSNALLSFQTSGLEGALVHALVVATALSSLRARRLAPTVLLMALAMCTRLDAVLTTLPFVLWAWRRGARIDGWAALAVTPIVAWLAFAAFYFGMPLPNTFYAKTGEPLFTTLVRGVLYLADYAYAEPLGAVLVGGAFVLAARASRREMPHRGFCITVGVAVALHLLYVIYVGGDYMRGRFVAVLLPLSALAWCAAWPARPLRTDTYAAAGLALLGLANLVFARGTSNAHDERRFHPASSILRAGYGSQFAGRPNGTFVVEPVVGFDLMRDAYHADPRIVWLDGLGLTDPFVARCPALPGERAGHVTRLMPRAYFAARGDVRLHERGAVRVREDASLVSQVEASRAEPGWPDETMRRRYEELETLTRGPLFAPGRFGLILRYSVGRQDIEIPPETVLHDPDPLIRWRE